MATTNWDPNNKAAGITLTGSNLVATSASGTNPGVSANRAISGKSYWEINVTTQSSTYAIGMNNRSWNNASGTLLGGDANGLAFRNAGTVLLNGATLSTIQTYAQGNVVQVAVDPQARLIWFNVGNGNWNNSALANPATGVGGIDFSSMSFGGLLPAFAAAVAASQAATAVFASGSWTFAAPSGFSSVDAVGASGVAAELVASTPPYDGAARQDPVTTAAQVSVTHASGGAWFGLSKNDTALATRQYSPQPGATGTAVSGVVQEGGVAVAKRVRAYDHASGDLLGEALSDAGTGAYSINTLGRKKVDVLAIDDPTFNALIYDQLTPV